MYRCLQLGQERGGTQGRCCAELQPEHAAGFCAVPAARVRAQADGQLLPGRGRLAVCAAASHDAVNMRPVGADKARRLRDVALRLLKSTLDQDALGFREGQRELDQDTP